MVRCWCCFVFVRVGVNVLSYVFLRCVFVLVNVCVLWLMSLHAVCELSCDDEWCSWCVCVCVCVFFCLCLCGLFVIHCVMLCGMCIFV